MNPFPQRLRNTSQKWPKATHNRPHRSSLPHQILWQPVRAPQICSNIEVCRESRGLAVASTKSSKDGRLSLCIGWDTNSFEENSIIMGEESFSKWNYKFFCRIPWGFNRYSIRYIFLFVFFLSAVKYDFLMISSGTYRWRNEITTFQTMSIATTWLYINLRRLENWFG